VGGRGAIAGISNLVIESWRHALQGLKSVSLFRSPRNSTEIPLTIFLRFFCLLVDTLYITACDTLKLSILLTCCIHWLLYLLNCTKTDCVFEAVSKYLDLSYGQTAYILPFSSQTSSLIFFVQDIPLCYRI
jgi:hypothetical protein